MPEGRQLAGGMVQFIESFVGTVKREGRDLKGKLRNPWRLESLIGMGT